MTAGVPQTTSVTTTYDKAARPTTSSDGSTYAHDSAGNLTQVKSSLNTGWSYSYDPWDRQTQATQIVGVGDTTVPNPIVSSYAYDALDRTLTKDKRLVAAGLSSPPILSETYSYAGITDELVQQKSSVLGQNDTVATTTSYANDVTGAPLVIKKSVTTTPLVSTVPPPSPVPSAVTEVTTRYAGLGPHGDLNYLTDQSGSVVGSYTYDPWGEPRSAVGEPTFLGFQADPTDQETGLVDMGARNYLPKLGRFTTEDPLEGDQSNPLSENPYIYGWDNPATGSDPTGMYNAKDAPCACHGNVTPRGSGSSMSSSSTRTESATTVQAGHPPAIGEDRGAYYSLCPAGSDISGCLIQQFGYMTELGYRAYRPNQNNGLVNDLEFLGAFVGVFAGPELAAVAAGAASSAGRVVGAGLSTLGKFADRVGQLVARISDETGAVGSGATEGILETPTVSSTKLQNIIDNLYRGTTNPARIGTGTTMDAVRYELETGEQVFGRSHILKAEESVRGLEKILGDSGLGYYDRLVGQSILDDLQNALRGMP